MENFVKRAESAGFPVIYVHTDSLVVPEEALPLFQAEIGPNMGQLKIDKRTEIGVVVKNKNCQPVFLQPANGDGGGGGA
jgi:hypothetical protein